MAAYGRKTLHFPNKWIRNSIALLALVGIPTAARAGFAATEVFLPATGRIAGLPPSQFYTTLWTTNLSTSDTVHFTFFFLKTGQANDIAPPSFSDTLAPGQTKIYENVIENKLGLASVLGAGRIVADGEIFASTRIYNQFHDTDNLGATAGLFFAGIPKSFAIGLGESASLQGVNQGSPTENMRYNFDVVETTGSNCTVHVAVLDASGTAHGSASYGLLPYEHIKGSVAALDPAIATINDRLVATVTAGTGRILIVGEQLGNISQDSTGFEMSYRGTLLGGGSAGVSSLNGLTGDLSIVGGTNITVSQFGNAITVSETTPGLAAVARDATLAGNGTIGSPLGVAIPLSFSNGATSGTIGASPVGLFAKTTDTTSGGVGVWGQGRVFGVYGNVVDGAGTQQAWGELGRFFNSHNIGVVGYSLDNTPGATSIWGTQGLGGSGETPAFQVGVWGDSHDAVGVFGSSSGTTEHGYRYGVLGHGVLGVEGVGTVAGPLSSQTISYGVEGDSYLVGDTRIGVFGYASGGSTNFAGYFFGDVDVLGTLTKSGGSFKIDDPIDPENKYLSHSFVESPDMKNIYDGEVTLDEHGTATIKLPVWFEALNREFRYQLTALDTPQPGLFVSKRIAGNQFAIAGGVPGASVSWQVTGTRHDVWAEHHRIPVESVKPPIERGTLLDAEDRGAPAEKSIGWKRSLAVRRADEAKIARETEKP